MTVTPVAPVGTTPPATPARFEPGAPQQGGARPPADAGPCAETCPLTAYGCRGTDPAPRWTLMSTHRVAEGVVEYCRCTCGSTVVLENEEITAFHHPAHSPQAGTDSASTNSRTTPSTPSAPGSDSHQRPRTDAM